MESADASGPTAAVKAVYIGPRGRSEGLAQVRGLKQTSTTPQARTHTRASDFFERATRIPSGARRASSPRRLRTAYLLQNAFLPLKNRMISLCFMEIEYDGIPSLGIPQYLVEYSTYRFA